MKKSISLLIASMITAFAVYPRSAAVSVSPAATKTVAEENNAPIISEAVDRTFEFDKEEMQDKAFLFYGDSLTARHGLSANDLDYTQILRSEFGFYSYNGAVSGATWTVDVDEHGVETSTNHLFSQFEKSKILIRDADYISIMLGTNDYGWGLRPLGTAEDHPASKEEAKTVYGAIRYALDYIIGANPDVKIMLMTPTLWPSRGFDKENSVGVTMGEIRTAVKEIGAEYRCKVVDMTDALSDTQDFQSDGLHISPYGNAKMASFIKNYGKN
ncbi:MAG: SGNH/GDSL hydrolase family protein [Candidatus Scatosoma sp.]